MKMKLRFPLFFLTTFMAIWVAASAQTYGPYNVGGNSGPLTVDVTSTNGIVVINPSSTGGGTGGYDWIGQTAKNGSSVTVSGSSVNISFSGVAAGSTVLVGTIDYIHYVNEDGSFYYYDSVQISVRNTSPTETWTAFNDLIRDWYDTTSWSPDASTVPYGQSFTQTKDQKRDWRQGERSNLGNERNVSTYNTYQTLTQTVTGTQPIAITAVSFANRTFNGSAQSTSVTSISPGGATYNVGGTSAATNVGTYSASVTGTGFYTGTVSNNWSIGPASITALNLNASSFTYNGAAQGPTIASSNVSWAVGTTTSFNASGTWSATGAGTYTASASGTGNFTGSASSNWTINKAPQTVSLSPAAPSVTVGSSLTFTASGLQSIAGYSWGGTGGATGAGSTKLVTFNSVGTYTVTVQALTDSNYLASNTASVTVTVTGIATSFSASPLTFTYDGGTKGPTLSVTPGAATYSTTGTTTASSVGSYSFTATANGSYSGTNTINWQITKAGQTITFPNPGDAPNGSTLTLNASASSGLAVSYSVTGPASLSGNTLTLTGVGAVTVTANQAGNSNYNAAAPVAVTLQSTNRTPSATISSSSGSINIGSTVTITATGTDADSNLTALTIDYLAPGAGAWTTGTSGAGSAWTGAATNTRSLTPSFTLNTAGAWQFRAYATDANAAVSPTVATTVTVVVPNYTLTVNAGTGGTATGGGTYPQGTVRSVSATPNANYIFDKWTGPVADSTAANTTVTMTGNATVTASFLPVTTVGTVDFGSAYLANSYNRTPTSTTKTAVINNSGNLDLSVSQIQTSGDFGSASTGGVTVTAGSSSNVVVTFTPSVAGARTGQIVFRTNDGANPIVAFALTGTGMTATPLPPTVSGSRVGSGALKVGDSMTTTVMGTSPSNALTKIGIAINAPNGTQIGPTYFSTTSTASISNNFSTTMNQGAGTYTILVYAEDVTGQNTGWITAFTVNVDLSSYSATINSYAVPAPGFEIWFTPSTVKSGTYQVQKP